MMYGKIITEYKGYQCDACEDTFEDRDKGGVFRNEEELAYNMARKGWRKIKGKWYCPICVRRYFRYNSLYRGYEFRYTAARRGALLSFVEDSHLERTAAVFVASGSSTDVLPGAGRYESTSGDFQYIGAILGTDPITGKVREGESHWCLTTDCRPATSSEIEDFLKRLVDNTFWPGIKILNEALCTTLEDEK